MEVAALVVVYIALGVLRPRWTTLLAASAPTVLAFAWLFMHEDIPGEELGPIDLIWYAGIGLAVGAALALATAAGVALRRAIRRGSLGPLSR
jgi:hypothetical protein